jgi:hypothetical protein
MGPFEYLGPVHVRPIGRGIVLKGRQTQLEEEINRLLPDPMAGWEGEMRIKIEILEEATSVLATSLPRVHLLGQLVRQGRAVVRYDVWAMRRTNIYLDDEQLESLRGLSERRGQPVATLVREAIDEWLSAQGVRRVPDDEWQRRFAALLERRTRIAEEEGFTQQDVDQDVMEAVREVRRARAARRR